MYINSTESIPETRSDGTDIKILMTDMLKWLKRFWYICISLILLGTVGAYIYTKSAYVPLYSSSCSFSITTYTTDASGMAAYSYYYSVNTSAQMAKTFPYIIGSELMRNKLYERFGTNDLNGTITASPVADANIFTVTVTGTSAQDAYNILNAVIETYPLVCEYIIGYTKMNVYTLPEPAEAPINTFSCRNNCIYGALAGLAATLLTALVYALTRRTVKTRADIEDRLSQNCIAEIPYVRKRPDSKGFITIETGFGAFSEAFRVLRKRVLDDAQINNKKVFAVTSCEPGEGKTTVAYNLALSLANAGKKTALLDMDTVNGTLQKLFSESAQVTGIRECFAGSSDISEVGVRRENNCLYFYFSGQTEYCFNTEKYRNYIDFLRGEYDCIIIDTPPGSVSSQTAAITDAADGILFVVRQDFSSISHIKTVINDMFSTREKISGLILNRALDGITGYGSYYSGSYKHGSSYRYGSYRYLSYYGSNQSDIEVIVNSKES